MSEVNTGVEHLLRACEYLSYREYEPNPRVRQAIENVEANTVSGPSGVGKGTLIKSLLEIEDPEDPFRGLYQQVRGFTTRDPRPGDNYYYLNSSADKAALGVDIRGGNLVQATAVYGNIYGTFPSDFPESGRVLFDCTPSESVRMEKLGFVAVKRLIIIPESFSDWINRWKGREGKLPEDFLPRYYDARRMIMQGLNFGGFSWLVNGQIDETVKKAREIFEGVPDKATLINAQNRAYEFVREIDRMSGAAELIPVSDEYDNLSGEDRSFLLKFGKNMTIFYNQGE